jgi:hypothetical protein
VDAERHQHNFLPHRPEYKHFYFNSSFHCEDYVRH